MESGWRTLLEIQIQNTYIQRPDEWFDMNLSTNGQLKRECSTSALAWVVFVAGWSGDSTSTEASSEVLGDPGETQQAAGGVILVMAQAVDA